MERCPNCKARYKGEDTCQRCGMDLGRLVQIETQVERLEHFAVKKILGQDAFAAEKILQEALTLQRSPSAKVLLEFIQNDLTFFCRNSRRCLNQDNGPPDPT